MHNKELELLAMVKLPRQHGHGTPPCLRQGSLQSNPCTFNWIPGNHLQTSAKWADNKAASVLCLYHPPFEIAIPWVLILRQKLNRIPNFEYDKCFVHVQSLVVL